MLIIITGNSGVGKSTLVNHLFLDDTIKQNLKIIKIVTTRTQKIYEVTNNEYIFVDKKTFWNSLQQNEFFYAQTYYNNYYGIKKSELDQAYLEQKIPLLTTILQPAINICQKFDAADILFIKILPDSPFQLETQLRKRAALRGTADEIWQRELCEPTNITCSNKVKQILIKNKPNQIESTIATLKETIYSCLSLEKQFLLQKDLKKETINENNEKNNTITKSTKNFLL